MPPVVQDESSERLKKISSFLTSFEFDTVQTFRKNEAVDVFQSKEKDDFDRRILTYKVGLWTIPELSPLHCSQRGWQLVDSEMLQCTVCKAFLCTRLPSNNQREAYVEFLSVLEDRIETGHKEACNYRYHASPLEFVQPSFKLLDLKKLSSTAQKLCASGNMLPLIKIKDFLAKLDLNEFHLSVLFKLGDALNDVKLTAAILTLCGWSHEKIDSIRCNSCLRTVGLWNNFSLEDENAYQRYAKRCLKKLKLKQKKELQAQIMEDTQRKENAANETSKDSTVENRGRYLAWDDEMDFVELENTIEDVYEEDSLLNESNNELKTTYLENPNGSQEDKDKCNDFPSQQNIEVIDDSLTKDDSNLEDSCHSPTDDLNMVVAGEENIPAKISAPSNFTANLDSLSSGQEYGIEDNKAAPIKTTSEADESSCQDDSTSNSSNDDLWAEALRPSEEASSKPKRLSTDSSSSQDSSAKLDNQQNDAINDEKVADIPLVESSNKEETDIKEVDSDSSKSSREKEINTTSDDSEKSGLLESSQTDTHDRKRRRSSSTNGELEAVTSPIPKRIHSEPTSTNEISHHVANISEPADAAVDEDQAQVQSVTPNSISDHNDSEGDDDDEKDARTPFDPLDEHRHWCGWLWKAHHKGKNVPGYLIIPPQLKEIIPKSPTSNLSKSQKYIENIEGLRVIRSFLEECMLPSRKPLNDDQMES